MIVHPAIENAYKVLDGEQLSVAEGIELAEQTHGSDLLDLLSLANKVRLRFAPAIQPCSIINAKSGRCQEKCRFCAQAGDHETGIEVYDLLAPAELLQAAGEVYAQGVRTFGIVSSGWGYRQVTPEFQQLLESLDALHAAYPDLRLCVSVGILSDETARCLAEHHTWRYNMNLQTNPERYAELITRAHSIADKIATIRHLQRYGVSICCGGIFGLGENWADRVAMAAAIRDLDVDGIPLNVLLPIKGTPLQNLPIMSPADAAKAFALVRLMNPDKMLKFAAGRETVMKDFQGLLMLAGMNSMITGGYLTTRGRSIAEDQDFISSLQDFGN